jgi:hypothetical protein
MKLLRMTLIPTILLILVLLAGCVSTEVTSMNGTYPPSSRVEILKEPPSRPYRQIGMVSAEGVVEMTELTARLSAKAQSIGADAVILLPVEYKMGLGGNQFPVLKGIAVKYD